MELWIILAIPAVSALTGLITAGVVMAVGGLGVLRALNRRLILVEERIEDTDFRITREVKRRASDAATEAKKVNPQAQAESYLAEHGPKGNGRPSVAGKF